MTSGNTTEWQTVRLGDLGRVVTGRTPPSSRPELFGERYPFVTPSDVALGVRKAPTERFISDEGADFLRRIILPPDTPSFVCIGATIGKVCLTDAWSFTNQQMNSIVVDVEQYDPRFVYYLLVTQANRIKSLAGGAATPIINKSAFSDVEVDVPLLPNQHRIASILSAYDDLIENNTRRIAILEEMARRLYEEWFVHFRFPGHEDATFIDTEQGSIPGRWEIKLVADTFEIIGGGTPSKKEPEYWEGGTINWYAPTDLTRDKTAFMDKSGIQITDLGLKKSSAKLFPPMSVMMTSRATIGAIAINTTEAATNQGFITCLPNENFPLYLLYQWLRANVETFINLGTGATFKEITKGTFKTIPVIVPPHDIAKKYQETVEPMMKMSLNLQRKNDNLRAQRDLLLPKLISGEITVSEGENNLENAVA
ncbi:restriction endonuclease subunit S [Thalassospira profundimaris]|uniref:restriction endonuclease subunit S n=1 Tax=Thalassospira profundimaris TaxID=502049 RepID=UPI000DEDC15A|nr:restriction endonuclease subunit S [Thalassospira profundimaris]